MTIKLKNWKLALLAFFGIIFFTSLGCWQLARAHKKSVLLSAYEARTARSPLTANELHSSQDVRFYRALLKGTFDNSHTFLLDNKTFAGKIGYEIYTPFKILGLNTSMLVDRGFVPIGYSRQILPKIKSIDGVVTILGMLNVAPTYVALGNMTESTAWHWPLRVQFVNLGEFSKIIRYPLFPYILTLSPKNPAAYPLKWQIVTMTPERHRGYAVQWFALGLTLLILFLTLGIKLENHK